MIRTLKALASLAEDAFDAALHMFAPPTNRAADELWDLACSANGRVPQPAKQPDLPNGDAAEHRDSRKPTWANERICICGDRYRAAPPYGTLPSFEQHIDKVMRSSAAAPVTAAAVGPLAPSPSPRDVEPGGIQLTRQQLDDAAWAVRCYAADRPDWSIQEAWLLLADELETAAQETK